MPRSQRLKSVVAARVEYGMHFVALKCQFFLATHLHQVAGPRDGLDALSDWAEAAITLGHINFMSQELILLPYMTRDFLSHEGRDSLCGDVIEAIARGPSSLPLLMRLMETTVVSPECASTPQSG